MTEVFCRIITEDCSAGTEARIVDYFNHNLGTIAFSPMQPYWKTPGCGELTCAFSSDRTPEEIQQMFADRWECDTADSSRSNVHCPGVTFLWIERN